ncbi:E3 ubiquitin/ISG15 ligase TRIM25-like [Discoglossus pictus]
MASADLREDLNCSICLDIYTDPVALSCGHNFCQDCIGSVLDTQEGSGVYTCPMCRAEFQDHPSLQRNLKLCAIVESFLHTQTEQEEAEIYCTYCVNSPVLAVKTCLQCEVSLCDVHLGAHNMLVDHVLMESTRSLLARKCTIHKKLISYYCSEDHSCVCVSCCLVGEHKGHQVDLLSEASEKAKEKLRNVLEKLTSKREKKNKIIHILEEHRRELQNKSVCESDHITALFMDIREQLKVLEKQVLSEITSQEQQISLRVSDLIQKLKNMKDELSRKIHHIEELCTETDPLMVLKGYSDEDLESNICPDEGDYDINVAGSWKMTPILLILTKGLKNFADNLFDQKVKRGFHEVAISDILLDVKTANNYIDISRDLKSAWYSSRCFQRPDVPERFMSCQVLSVCSFSSGEHYWEVDVSEAKKWIIGVVYKSIKRKINGNESYIGYNDKLSGLSFNNSLGVRHNKHQDISDSPVQLVGIYLNYEAGLLSFYDWSGAKRHLHTFTATFTEPLHAAFYVYKDSRIRLIG